MKLPIYIVSVSHVICYIKNVIQLLAVTLMYNHAHHPSLSFDIYIDDIQVRCFLLASECVYENGLNVTRERVLKFYQSKGK